MSELLTSIAAKKKRLDERRPLAPQALANLEHYYDIELTYTSNAIEGNTLSPVAVRPEDRLEYILSLQQEQAGQGAESFNGLLYRRLDATLGEYLSALQEAQTPGNQTRSIRQPVN